MSQGLVGCSGEDTQSSAACAFDAVMHRGEIYKDFDLHLSQEDKDLLNQLNTTFKYYEHRYDRCTCLQFSPDISLVGGLTNTNDQEMLTCVFEKCLGNTYDVSLKVTNLISRIAISIAAGLGESDLLEVSISPIKPNFINTQGWHVDVNEGGSGPSFLTDYKVVFTLKGSSTMFCRLPEQDLLGFIGEQVLNNHYPPGYVCAQSESATFGHGTIFAVESRACHQLLLCRQ
jgi:hypothetical protein